MAKTLISKEQQDLIAQLEQDVQHAFQNVVGNDQFWCRTLVRAVFSYFEAHSFVIRSVTAKLLKVDQGDLESVAKMALLADTAYQPGKTGKLEDAGEPKTPFINQLAFTLRTYAEVSGMDAAKINGFFSDNAFNQLQRSKRVRDRLTHPKRLDDAKVSKAEVTDVSFAYNWLVRFVSEVEKSPKKPRRRKQP
jgi:hypothetical protein